MEQTMIKTIITAVLTFFVGVVQAALIPEPSLNNNWISHGSSINGIQAFFYPTIGQTKDNNIQMWILLVPPDTTDQTINIIASKTLVEYTCSGKLPIKYQPLKTRVYTSDLKEHTFESPNDEIIVEMNTIADMLGRVACGGKRRQKMKI